MRRAAARTLKTNSKASIGSNAIPRMSTSAPPINAARRPQTRTETWRNFKLTHTRGTEYAAHAAPIHTILSNESTSTAAAEESTICLRYMSLSSVPTSINSATGQKTRNTVTIHISFFSATLSKNHALRRKETAPAIKATALVFTMSENSAAGTWKNDPGVEINLKMARAKIPEAVSQTYRSLSRVEIHTRNPASADQAITTSNPFH